MKRKSIQLHNRKIKYLLKKSVRARRLRLAVYCDGKFVVTVPEGFSESTAEKYIISRSRWILSKLDFFKKVSMSKTLKLGKNAFMKYKESALMLASERIKYFNKKYRFYFNKVNIKNQKTRWGSCSKKKNLNFNFKIVLLPPNLRDYIIVHELCHLREFNHSRRFWKLVSRSLPDYQRITEELKVKGLTIL